ncbi:methenyltetrahydromethanopterin cyclohydrolase [Telmatocola sphagniphila]|uniref:Methenyltetrahydromethanopterin cyclohydrolase n=1 Tax=Telmatocola sphagniphila TaxID=1123043 RepID=A0A8E6B507_9BACT|nr:methenyltetrahydromethanopterin cyclohydrolase [Telmatocola sphagniphila]QVL31559.1 methenyltetrahydromethanopterin cyclohydrolase [Telmatocola sphagniphila]
MRESHRHNLNGRAGAAFDYLEENSHDLRVGISSVAKTKVIDCGVKSPGGLTAGLQLARICLSDYAQVELKNGNDGVVIQVYSDHPILACLASQYAGWQINVGSFFAMGSGPMRAAYGKEKLFEQFPDYKELPSEAVGVLETRKPPTAEVIDFIAHKLPPGVDKIKLAYAPTASLAGSIQVVARSLETALHKLHELKFDLTKIVSGHGVAPMPPIGKDDIQAIGWTNDAILYGGKVTLWVNSDDDVLNEIGSKVPSRASADFGRPFGEIFKSYNGDFYKIDPMLFSPAEITFVNLKTGRLFRFGRVEPDLLRKSFAGY